MADIVIFVYMYMYMYMYMYTHLRHYLVLANMVLQGYRHKKYVCTHDHSYI